MGNKREEELLAQGWTRQFVADEPRLSEAVELYKSLGMEVLLEHLPAEAEEGECRGCLEVTPEQYRIIYTRKVGGSTGALGDDLFASGDVQKHV
jgi:hypothetical protein